MFTFYTLLIINIVVFKLLIRAEIGGTERSRLDTLCD
jgi:hypothetical protein